MKRIIFLSALLTACTVPVTEYKPLIDNSNSLIFRGYNEGYIDKKISDKKYEIQVKGSTSTRYAKLEEYFHRRASELCGDKKYSHKLESKSETKISDPMFTGTVYLPGRTDFFPYVTGEIECN
jgi:hypothetical protein